LVVCNNTINKIVIQDHKLFILTSFENFFSDPRSPKTFATARF